MNANQFATLLYGALSLYLLATFAADMNSPTAFMLAVIASGLAWVFQTLEAVVEPGTPASVLLEIIYGLVPTLFIIALAIAYFGGCMQCA